MTSCGILTTQIICRHNCKLKQESLIEGKAIVSCHLQGQQKETLKMKTTEDDPMGWEMQSTVILVTSRKVKGA